MCIRDRCFTTDSDDLLLLVATETGVIRTKLNGSSAEYIGGMLSIESNGRFVYPVFYLLSIHCMDFSVCALNNLPNIWDISCGIDLYVIYTLRARARSPRLCKSHKDLHHMI